MRVRNVCLYYVRLVCIVCIVCNVCMRKCAFARQLAVVLFNGAHNAPSRVRWAFCVFIAWSVSWISQRIINASFVELVAVVQLVFAGAVGRLVDAVDDNFNQVV
jgi:hypothetical protein